MKNNITLKLISIALLVTVAVFCYSQESKWTVSDGWVLKKAANADNYEKFFAIGLWAIPGYSFNKLSVQEEKLKYPNNYVEYKNKIKHFNLFYLQTGYGKEYMDDVIKMGGTAEFSWWFEKEYFNTDRKKDASYHMMRDIEQSTNTTRLKELIKISIDLTLNEAKKTSSDFIWAPFDEIASGVQYWSWPNNVTDMVYSEIKKRTPEKLVYIDLLGSDGGEGNSFLFQQYYKKKIGRLPKEPPFDVIYKNQKTDNSPLNFHFNHQGSSMFEYKNGERVKKQFDLPTFTNNWYESVKMTAGGYRNSGDIFGINSYSVTYDNPAMAGVTVDAIKAGIAQSTPVWLFFDSNGYAKPQNTSIADYLKNIKCQIYTSIVHGATGVLFWSDLTKDDTVFNTLIPIVQELKKNENILYLQTTEQRVSGDIHYMIKNDGNNTKYLIAVNTNTKNNVYFVNKFSSKSVFAPLEVYIKKL